MPKPQLETLEEPVGKTKPPSRLLCQCLGYARRSSPDHTARTHWKLRACPGGRAGVHTLPDLLIHVPGVMFMCMCMSM